MKCRDCKYCHAYPIEGVGICLRERPEKPIKEDEYRGKLYLYTKAINAALNDIYLDLSKIRDNKHQYIKKQEKLIEDNAYWDNIISVVTLSDEAPFVAIRDEKPEWCSLDYFSSGVESTVAHDEID